MLDEYRVQICPMNTSKEMTNATAENIMRRALLESKFCSDIPVSPLLIYAKISYKKTILLNKMNIKNDATMACSDTLFKMST